jgi:SEC-C motif
MSGVGRNDPCSCGSGRKWKKCCGARVPGVLPFEAVSDKGALFGSGTAFLTSLLDSFERAAEPRSYRIMPMAEYATLSGIAERNQVYWREILFRAHFGASTGMLRLNEWLHGSERALVDGNVLMLAAGIRGFLEACADTWQGFSDVAPTLADSHTIVRRAIKGELPEQVALAPELENALIHFSYARKLSPGEGPALHSAATAKDCLSVLSESAPDVVDVYHTLCDYTHPAAPSLFRFGSESTHPDTLTFDPKSGPHKLAEIVALSEHVGRVALVLAAGPLVTTLKILNAFAFAPVATPWADSVNLGFSDVWRELQSRLSSQVGPKTASDEQQDELIAELNAQYLPFGKSKRRKER